ncbi:MAG TPA: PKD domain-containing protein, partial [Thermoplasmatales archaeon]|nr:PKD domain-containing protein [Thermoplasmatales archaeon]
MQFHGSAVGGTPPYTFTWDFGDGTFNVEGQNPTHKYIEPGTYTVKLTVTDSNYDVATDTTEAVIDEPKPLQVNADASDSNVEIGEPISFTGTATGGIRPYEFIWDFGDGTTAVESRNAVHIYEEKGRYTVTLTVTDHEGSTATDAIHVTVKEQGKEAVIGEIQGGFGVKVTITAGDEPVDWTITLRGRVFLGGQSSGTIPANTAETVKMPFSLGIGRVDITVTANHVTKEAEAFMLGPLILNLKETS